MTNPSPQKTALAWSGESKPPAGTPGSATPGAGGGTQVRSHDHDHHDPDEDDHDHDHNESSSMQGLAHWMSVMAEHMNHESSLHPAYMWHNGIDQKMSLTEQQQLLQKGGSYFNNISGGGGISMISCLKPMFYTGN